MVEVACGYREATLIFYGVRYGNGCAEGAVAFAVEEVGVIDAGRTGNVQLAVQIEISHRAGLGSGRAFASAGWVDRRLAEGTIASVQKHHHTLGEIGNDEVLAT